MRAALISDIHSNLPALESILAAIEKEGADEIWCLGDVVGYGAQPNECTELVREKSAICLVGNHDLAALDTLDISTFSPAAADAARWTQTQLSDESREFLTGLSPAGARVGIGLFHASPRDPVWEYVLSLEAASECMDANTNRIGLIGHSHVALYFTRPDDGKAAQPPPGVMSPPSPLRVRGGTAVDDATLQMADGNWLLNPGSVGQPRDGDARAAWCMLDTRDWIARYRRVHYDIDAAANSILEAGLPRHLAKRLYSGQ